MAKQKNNNEVTTVVNIDINDSESLKKLDKNKLIAVVEVCKIELLKLNEQVDKLKNTTMSSVTLESEVRDTLNLLEVERRKIQTVYEIMANTSSVIEHRINDVGQVNKRLMITDDTIKVANALINSCLKQLGNWVIENDINKEKQSK